MKKIDWDGKLETHDGYPVTHVATFTDRTRQYPHIVKVHLPSEDVLTTACDDTGELSFFRNDSSHVRNKRELEIRNVFLEHGMVHRTSHSDVWSARERADLNIHTHIGYAVRAAGSRGKYAFYPLGSEGDIG